MSKKVNSAKNSILDQMTEMGKVIAEVGKTTQTQADPYDPDTTDEPQWFAEIRHDQGGEIYMRFIRKSDGAILTPPHRFLEAQGSKAPIFMGYERIADGVGGHITVATEEGGWWSYTNLKALSILDGQGKPVAFQSIARKIASCITRKSKNGVNPLVAVSLNMFAKEKGLDHDRFYLFERFEAALSA